MGDSSLSGSDWSEREIDLVIGDYFEMLTLELAREPYVKAHRNAALQKLVDRPRGAIEFKHCNISAVLEILGIPTIDGYKPRRNFQNALIAGVDRYLDHSEPVRVPVTSNNILAESKSIWIGSLPTPSTLDDTPDPEPLRRLVRKFDPAARDEKNRELGRLGEELVLEHERQRLTIENRRDLAKNLRWVSQEDGDGAGYDILSFESDGRERLIEVKTTNGNARTPFFISENERTFSEERSDAFCLMRLYNFAREPAAFEIKPPLEKYVTLSAISYRATI